MYIEKYYRLRYIYILSIVNCFLMTIIFKVDVSFDTYTYIDAWSSFQDGIIDKWRTPIYPVFLGLMKAFFGINFLYFVVAIQHLFYLVSIRYLYLLMRDYITNKNISFFLTLFYALYPSVITYNCCIVTETFAVSGIIFLLFSTSKLYKTQKWRFVFFSFIWLFFLIFLRPAVMYLLPVLMVFWLIVAIERKKECCMSVVGGITSCAFVSIFLLVYMAMFKCCYGVFAPSGIGLINKYAIAKAANIIVYEKENNGLLFYQEAENYINNVGLKSFSDSLDRSISLNKDKYIKRLWQNARNASEFNLFEPSYSNGIIGAVTNIMGVKIKIIYFIFIIYGIVLLRWKNLQKDVSFFSYLFFMIGLCNYILIIIASPGEYGRLSIPAIPVYLIMIGQLLEMIKIKRVSEVIFI